MNRTQKSKCRQIAEKYGLRSQEQQAVSELTELQYVLTRRPNQRGETWEEEHDKSWTESLIDEIADVYVMLEQLQALHNISADDVNAVIDYKLERQLGRIGGCGSHGKCM